MISLFYLLIGLVVVLATCEELFESTNTIKEIAISFVTLLVLIQYWPFWLIIYFIKKRKLKERYNDEIRKLP